MTSFAVGERALVRLGNPQSHTRVPGYLRGRRGEVIAVAGEFVLADDSARGIRSHPQTVYTVRFEAREIWGDDAPAGVSVTAELWESYLEIVR
ncbi:MAG: SH3-like domain-containing protein [Candidatus Baltobacteraceae bacterium]